MVVWVVPKKLQFNYIYIRPWQIGLEVCWGKFAEHPDDALRLNFYILVNGEPWWVLEL